MTYILNNKRAFTLIQLIIVITILGILVGISIPVFGNITDQAEENVDKENAKIISIAVYRGLVDEVLIVNDSNKLYNTVTNRTYGAANSKFFKEMKGYLSSSLYPISDSIKDRFFFQIKNGLVRIYYKDLDKKKIFLSSFRYDD